MAAPLAAVSGYFGDILPVVCFEYDFDSWTFQFRQNLSNMMCQRGEIK